MGIERQMVAEKVAPIHSNRHLAGKNVMHFVSATNKVLYLMKKVVNLYR